MDHKAAAFDLSAAPDDAGHFEGYGSIFGNKDSGGDIMLPGAFTKSLASARERKKMPKMLWQHDPNQPIGVWEEVREDTRGLYVKGRLLLDLPMGRQASILLKEGALDGLSIGYRTIDADRDKGVRRLKEVELWEVSVVTFPMNDAAGVTAFKSATTEREFEGFLRDAGYSRKEATAITLHGFKGHTGLRDAVSDDGQNEGVLAFIETVNRMSGV